MDPFDAAWLVIKEMMPAFQDDPNAAEEDMRHFQTMQNMRDIYTPRGNTSPAYIQESSGAKPLPFFGEAYYQHSPFTEALDFDFQADNARNPADARRFREMAEASRARNAPPAPEVPVEAESDEIDFDELGRLLAEAHRRSVAPLSYRRKVKPLSDFEVQRDLNRLRRFRR